MIINRNEMMNNDRDNVESECGASGKMNHMIDARHDAIPSMIIHGTSHLIGCDHEDDGDCEHMVQKEE